VLFVITNVTITGHGSGHDHYGGYSCGGDHGDDSVVVVIVVVVIMVTEMTVMMMAMVDTMKMVIFLLCLWL
jgi:hypothetical protein